MTSLAIADIIYDEVLYVRSILFERCQMEYLSVKQTAEKWGVSTKRIQYICKQGRSPGAFIIGNSWAIPADAEKPKDARIKSGKYIKKDNMQN